MLSLLANLLVIPVQPIIMYLGSTAALLGLALLPLGTVIGWAAWLFLTYTIRTTEVLSTWAGPAGSTARLHPATLCAYYGLLVLLTWKPVGSHLSLQSLPRLLRQGVVRKGLLAVLVMALVLVWVAVSSLPDGRLAGRGFADRTGHLLAHGQLAGFLKAPGRARCIAHRQQHSAQARGKANNAAPISAGGDHVEPLLHQRAGLAQVTGYAVLSCPGDQLNSISAVDFSSTFCALSF